MKNGKLLLSSLLFAAACTGPTSPTQGALSADPTARSFGIASYAVEGDTVRMLDAYGLELGTLAVRDVADRRIIDVALVDGTTDEIEVYRPMSDGSFHAPMQRDFTAGAALADAALAPLLASHGIKFRVEAAARSKAELAPSILANTTSCSTPSSDTPDGCARPANTSVGCTNPSQLPAAVIYNYATTTTLWSVYYTSQGECTQAGAVDCANAFGGQYYDWEYSHETCTGSNYSWNPVCHYQYTQNQWVASCPRSSCGTVGQYDAVPRLRTCYDPGSCTKSQGTVGCTPYH